MGQRYKKQVILQQIGEKGQKSLSRASVLVAGCGGLGCIIADFMVRAGVGKITLVDRDVVELDNLHRQILFDENDAGNAVPKALAASRKLKKANSEVDIEALVADISPENVEKIIGSVDLVLDGTDNFETRFLLNDACLKKGIPWIYGGVVATRGMCLAVIPGKTPCLRCFLPEPPPPGEVPTCETVGVLGPAVALTASLEVSEGLKILMGKKRELLKGMVNFDIWTGDWDLFQIEKDPECPACSRKDFRYLQRGAARTTILCGENAVQVTPLKKVKVSFPELTEHLAQAGKVFPTEHVVRFKAPPFEFLIFSDGRTIIKGTSNEAEARKAFSKYLGF